MPHRIHVHAAALLAAVTAACDTTPTFPTSVARPDPVMVTVPSPLRGTYTLTVEVDASCTVLPAGERTRRYDATVSPQRNRLAVTLSGASFLAGRACTASGGPVNGLGCHQFLINEDLDWVGADLRPQDDTRAGHIVERLPTGGWIEITGSASGIVEDFSQFSVEGPANVWFCPDDVEAPFDAPCAGSAPGSGTAVPPTSRSCESRMRLEFTRR
jgi:hypothetical protein